MERVAAMASVSTSSSLLATTVVGGKQRSNVQSLASCRAFSSGRKLNGGLSQAGVRSNVVVRVVSKQAAVSTPTKENAVQKEVYDCVVVGAGISGLCTAQALATRYAPIAFIIIHCRFQ